jgi:hypothetical protein
LSGTTGKISWKNDRLLVSTRTSGYSIVRDARHPTMWRVRQPDGSLSDIINRTRARDAAAVMLDGPPQAPYSPQTEQALVG